MLYGYISFLLFDTVVRYGQQHNPGYEAENDRPPNAPYWRGTAKIVE
ncbi:MAG: hypothetical protein F6K37_19725 [Moorea sp. SIO4E2]|nr:hypothetical protein [Moorena sp. SIO4E2]NEQ08096.1 hypothetical protein [Moorena sp. SIO4E2]